MIQRISFSHLDHSRHPEDVEIRVLTGGLCGPGTEQVILKSLLPMDVTRYLPNLLDCEISQIEEGISQFKL